jgi:DHA1 family tetracycline resistance protein-like MFS transporter
VKNKSSLFLIFLAVFIDLIGFGILVPILPAITSRQFQADDFEIGILVAVFSFVQFIFNPIFGGISDKKGRKPIIVACLLLSVLGYIIFAFADSYWVLLISRTIAGLGGSSISVAQAYIADITTKEDRSKGMGLIGAAFALGFVFGPLIGGLLSKFGTAVIGFSGAGFSFIAFLITIIFLPESLKVKNEDTVQKKRRAFFNFSHLIEVLKRPAIGVVIILFFIITFSMSNIFGVFSLLGFKAYHLTDLQIGLLYGTMGIFSAVAQTGIIHILSKYLKEITIISLGAFLLLIALVLMPLSTGFNMLAVLSGTFTMGTGLLVPTILSLISKVTPDREQGAVLGVNQSFSALARVLGPLWGGFSFEYFGYVFPFFTGAFFIMIIFIYSVFYLTKKININTEDDKIKISPEM